MRLGKDMKQAAEWILDPVGKRQRVEIELVRSGAS